METITKQSNRQDSLLTEAFEALIEKLGPTKAIQVWQVLVPPRGEDYLKIRPKLFEGKDDETLDKEIRKFNRQKPWGWTEKPGRSLSAGLFCVGGASVKDEFYGVACLGEGVEEFVGAGVEGKVEFVVAVAA